MIKRLLAGAAAGAAGTTALNAVTYADMAWRGRAASQTPKKSVEEIAKKLDVAIPGDGDKRDNRLMGLGALSGIATGVAVGAVYGALDVFHVRPGLAKGTLLAASTAILAANVPMVQMGLTDPRKWSVKDWVSDVVPHLAYGAVVAAAFRAAAPSKTGKPGKAGETTELTVVAAEA